MNITSAYFKLISATLFCLLTLYGCGGGNNIGNEPSEPTPEPPSAQTDPIVPPNDTETELQIRQDYRNYLADNGMGGVHVDAISIHANLGVYNGYTVVLISSSQEFAAVETDTVVDGLLFTYPDPTRNIIAWKEGQIFELWEARNLGLLTKEDLTDIAGGHTDNQDLLDGSHAGLSAGAENRIKEDYLFYLFHLDDNRRDLTINDVWIEAYYGTYNNRAEAVHGTRGLAAVMTDFEGSGYTFEEREVVIDDVVFHYNSGNSIIAWTPYGFFTLQDAYDIGLLIKEDLVNIARSLNVPID